MPPKNVKPLLELSQEKARLILVECCGLEDYRDSDHALVQQILSENNGRHFDTCVACIFGAGQVAAHFRSRLKNSNLTLAFFRMMLPCDDFYKRLAEKKRPVVGKPKTFEKIDITQDECRDLWPNAESRLQKVSTMSTVNAIIGALMRMVSDNRGCGEGWFQAFLGRSAVTVLGIELSLNTCISAHKDNPLAEEPWRIMKRIIMTRARDILQLSPALKKIGSWMRCVQQRRDLALLWTELSGEKMLCVLPSDQLRVQQFRLTPHAETAENERLAALKEVKEGRLDEIPNDDEEPIDDVEARLAVAGQAEIDKVEEMGGDEEMNDRGSTRLTTTTVEEFLHHGQQGSEVKQTTTSVDGKHVVEENKTHIKVEQVSEPATNKRPRSVQPSPAAKIQDARSSPAPDDSSMILRNAVPRDHYLPSENESSAFLQSGPDSQWNTTEWTGISGPDGARSINSSSVAENLGNASCLKPVLLDMDFEAGPQNAFNSMNFGQHINNYNYDYSAAMYWKGKQGDKSGQGHAPLFQGFAEGKNAMANQLWSNDQNNYNMDYMSQSYYNSNSFPTSWMKGKQENAFREHFATSKGKGGMIMGGQQLPKGEMLSKNSAGLGDDQSSGQWALKGKKAYYLAMAKSNASTPGGPVSESAAMLATPAAPQHNESSIPGLIAEAAAASKTPAVAQSVASSAPASAQVVAQTPAANQSQYTSDSCVSSCLTSSSSSSSSNVGISENKAPVIALEEQAPTPGAYRAPRPVEEQEKENNEESIEQSMLVAMEGDHKAAPVSDENDKDEKEIDEEEKHTGILERAWRDSVGRPFDEPVTLIFMEGDHASAVPEDEEEIEPPPYMYLIEGEHSAALAPAVLECGYRFDMKPQEPVTNMTWVAFQKMKKTHFAIFLEYTDEYFRYTHTCEKRFDLECLTAKTSNSNEPLPLHLASQCTELTVCGAIELSDTDFEALMMARDEKTRRICDMQDRNQTFRESGVHEYEKEFKEFRKDIVAQLCEGQRLMKFFDGLGPIQCSEMMTQRSEKVQQVAGKVTQESGMTGGIGLYHSIAEHKFFKGVLPKGAIATPLTAYGCALQSLERFISRNLLDNTNDAKISSLGVVACKTIYGAANGATFILDADHVPRLLCQCAKAAAGTICDAPPASFLPEGTTCLLLNGVTFFTVVVVVVLLVIMILLPYTTLLVVIHQDHGYPHASGFAHFTEALFNMIKETQEETEEQREGKSYGDRLRAKMVYALDKMSKNKIVNPYTTVYDFVNMNREKLAGKKEPMEIWSKLRIIAMKFWTEFCEVRLMEVFDAEALEEFESESDAMAALSANQLARFSVFKDGALDNLKTKIKKHFYNKRACNTGMLGKSAAAQDILSEGEQEDDNAAGANAAVCDDEAEADFFGMGS
ncbi:unnamed protein product [Amoebophrya sp. A25]|nr:unnamed protein product [Amoebophrya sp. A25]|eukprot:GSA25T00017335001.1